MADIAWFREISNQDVATVGGKGASLGEMFNAGLPVPPGFMVTAQAYEKFITKTGIDKEIYEVLKDLDVENNTALQEAAKKVQKIIIKTPMLEDIKKEITESYNVMTVDHASKQGKEVLEDKEAKAPFVAVRSSATAEDLPTASFAGQQATYLNVRGTAELIEAVQKCWASLFTARAIYYRIRNNFEHSKVFIAVVVQKMVNSEKAGVMFSVNPVSNNSEEVMIEAGYGLGETVVGGQINPDQYIVDKSSNEVKSTKVHKQTWMLVRSEQGKNVKKDVPSEKQEAQILTNYEIMELAKLAVKIEEHYKKPQDLEYAIENSKIYIVQSRPITTLKKKEVEEQSVDETDMIAPEKAKMVLTGIAASPGVGIGPVKIVNTAQELDKIKEGDVLVAEMTNPDYVSAMQKSVAIVTNSGGSTSHAAIVGREMGIPVIVGTDVATKELKENQIITVDATNGKVYDGKVNLQSSKKDKAAIIASAPSVQTVTEIKVIMDLPEFAEKAASTGADGVGLLRCEMMLAKHEHPAYLVKHGEKNKLIDTLVSGISKIASAFKGKPVWYRTSDFRTDEYRNLPGGEEEPHEANPMLGWHGIRRGIDEIGLLTAEFEAIKKVHDMGHTNVGIMLPMVTHVEQVETAKELLEKIGMEPQENIDFGVMIETPASVQIIEEICKVGIDFVSFGTNDLTQFTLALDRNNTHVQNLYDEMHPAVLRQIKQVIDTCKRYAVETSICGQAGSRPEMAEFLVNAGIDSISANSDAVSEIKQVVARAERKLLLSVARKKLED